MINEKIKIAELQHLKLEFIKQEYIVTLMDIDGFEILKGYGASTIKAMNNLHKNLL